jgi:hypothetical protein
MNCKIFSLSLFAWLAISVFCATYGEIVATFSTSQDTTVFSQDGNVSAGGLGWFMVGNTGEDGGTATRNALMRFELTSIPAGSIINSVTLTLTQTKNGPSATDEYLDMHRILQSWGEGSVAGSFSGSQAQLGDATFTYRNYLINTWDSPGGDYDVKNRSARTIVTNVGLTPTAFTFDSQSMDFANGGMLADVQSWVDNPASNYGWYLLLPEFIEHNARRFGSREGPSEYSPVLTINFTAVPEPGSILLFSLAATVISMRRSRRCA